jgi:hypothetical protein
VTTMTAKLDAPHLIDLASRDGRSRPVADVDVLCAASARILRELAWQLAEITGLRLRRLWCEGEA